VLLENLLSIVRKKQEMLLCKQLASLGDIVNDAGTAHRAFQLPLLPSFLKAKNASLLLAKEIEFK
jgi:3-phosphoglycerate kinase